MRTRWRWPILKDVARVELDDWVGAWMTWFVAALVFIVLPAAIVDSRHGNPYMGTYLTVALIVYGVPIAGGLLAAAIALMRYAFHTYGSHLIPRRVTEPVRDDLRAQHARDSRGA